MKILFCSLLASSSLMLLLVFTPNTHAGVLLDKQMENFWSRLSIYSGYRHHHYSSKERNTIIKAALKDGVIATSISTTTILCISKWDTLLMNIINIPASLLLEIKRPRNIPFKYQQLHNEVEKIKKGQLLTTENVKQWINIYNEIYDYDAHGYSITEDKNVEVPYYYKISALNKELYELLWDKKIAYANNNAQLVLIEHFVKHHKASKESLLYRLTGKLEK